LYWEGFRRTDLIRYGRFVEATYLWQWKGGVAGGRAVETYRVLFPIPASELQANPNLEQNTGY
jgi:starch-binding outer membrane protein, SusD/RagB family